MNIVIERELPDGAWKDLFPHALSIIEDIKRNGTPDPFWTFGGGTVLMFRYQHRLSKDIDIFVPDPQYLGFVTPRLSDIAAAVSTDYVEDQSSYVKLIRPEGEIDFVATPNLAESPFEIWNINGQHIRVETAAEIVAKKLWHRDDRATARDLFDLSLVIEQEPEALIKAAKFLLKNADLFISQIASRKTVLERQFAEIDTLAYKPSYDEAAQRATAFLKSLQ
jgi:predicted nucleotidyltransferase component of viral defense system